MSFRLYSDSGPSIITDPGGYDSLTPVFKEKFKTCIVSTAETPKHERSTTEAWFGRFLALLVTCSVTVSGQLLRVIYHHRHFSVSCRCRRPGYVHQTGFLKTWSGQVTHTHSHTRINTYTQRWHAGASLDGLLWWNLRAESSAPLGELNSGHRRVTVTGRGNPGQCLAPPPALPLWRPSWLGRSHWWEGQRPLSRSCSVDRERRVNGRAMRFIAFCPNSSSTKAVSKRALLLHCYCYCATNID